MPPVYWTSSCHCYSTLSPTEWGIQLCRWFWSVLMLVNCQIWPLHLILVRSSSSIVLCLERKQKRPPYFSTSSQTKPSKTDRNVSVFTQVSNTAHFVLGSFPIYFLQHWCSPYLEYNKRFIKYQNEFCEWKWSNSCSWFLKIIDIINITDIIRMLFRYSDL